MEKIRVKEYLTSPIFFIKNVEIYHIEHGPNAGSIGAKKNPGKEAVEYIKANKQEIIEFIQKTKAEYQQREDERKAATQEFLVGGYEMHSVTVDTRKDLEKQFASIAARYPHDCTAENVKEAYERAIAKKALDAEKAIVDEIENCKKHIAAADKSGRVYATQAEAKAAWEKYNDIHNEGGDGYVPKHYVQSEIDAYKKRLEELTNQV